MFAVTALAIQSFTEEKGTALRTWTLAWGTLSLFAGKAWLALMRGLLSSLGMTFCKTRKSDRWTEDADAGRTDRVRTAA